MIRRIAAPLAIAVQLLIAPLASAGNSADEADLAFALGNEAYAARRYQEALRNYFLSYRLVPNRNVLFNIARCYEALERFDEAYRYYSDLSREQLAEEDAREVEKSMQRLRPRVALITVTTEPDGADVYVDRLDLGSRGRSPLTLALPPGKHDIIVQREGYRFAQRPAVLTRGKEVTEAFQLELITGRVLLSGEPEGAWVREALDGPELAKVPGTVTLPPGKRILYVGAPGRATGQYLVDVKADDSVPLAVTLGPEPVPSGKLIVTANRENASVSVDGVESGFTPAVLTLTEGEHEVVVSLPQLTPHRTRVRVTRDQEQRLHAELRYSPPPIKAASKSLANVDEAPASITVITREEIEAFGYQTLADALAGVRGIYTSNDRLYSYLGIRGFSPPGDLNTRVLILWDGHALNDIWAGQGFVARDLNVDLDEVARIEVVRGPGSALYGTGAFFAVINVVPRDSLGSRRNVEVTGAAGALGAWRGHGAVSYAQSEDVSVHVSGAAFNARGADMTLMPEEGLILGQDGERAYGATMRARWGHFTLSALVNNRHKDIPTAPFGSLPNAAGTRSTDSRGFAEARYERDFDDGDGVSVRAYYDGTRYRGRWPSPGAEPGETILFQDAAAADWVGSEARYRFSFFDRHQLTVGAEAQYQFRVQQEIFAAESQPLETRSRTLLSAYALGESRLHSRVFLSVGVRVDRYLDLDVTPITPRLALILRPYAAGVTKLVGGLAFRAPNIYELYYHDLNISQRPALELRPETITTIELEHSHDLTEELRVTVSGYHNRINDLIILREENAEVPLCGAGADPTQCFWYQNAESMVRAFGAEAGLRWQPGRWALVDASYSFVNLISSDPGLKAGTPAHLASGRLMMPILDPAVRLAFQATYQSARYSPRVPEGAGEALLVNVGLSGETERLRYFAGVQNLLDAEYALPVGDEFVSPVIPQYGRTFVVQLTAAY